MSAILLLNPNRDSNLVTTKQIFQQKQSAHYTRRYRGKCVPKIAFSAFIQPVWGFLKKKKKGSKQYSVPHFLQKRLYSFLLSDVPLPQKWSCDRPFTDRTVTQRPCHKTKSWREQGPHQPLLLRWEISLLIFNLFCFMVEHFYYRIIIVVKSLQSFFNSFRVIVRSSRSFGSS